MTAPAASSTTPGERRESVAALFETFAREWFSVPGVYEVRIPRPHGRHGTVSGYFDDAEALVREVLVWDGRAEALYVSLNPVHPDLLARGNNRLVEWAKATTADSEIVRRVRLLIDFDPVRPAGISSSDAEHGAALARAQEIRAELRTRGWSEPLYGDSGNGAHLVYALDLANDEASTRLVESVLRALAAEYGDELVEIDAKVGNAARITKFLGTMTQKGDATGYRPHRRSAIVEMPDEVVAVPRELLEELAARDPKRRTNGTAQTSSGRRQSAASTDPELWLRGWIAEHGVEVRRAKPYEGGTLFELNACPWADSHTDGHRDGAYLTATPGGIGGGCQHSHCADRGWADFRDRYESAWRERRERSGNGRDREEPPARGDSDAPAENPGRFFDEGGLVVPKLGEAIRARGHVRLGQDARLYRYREGVYRGDGDALARASTRDLLGKLFKRRHLDEVLTYLRADYASVTDRQPEEINLRNGLLDWRTAPPILRPHTPEIVSTAQLPVRWDPGARCPRFDAFLVEVMPEDAIDFIWEVIGYAMLAANPLRVAVLLLGPGRNGKSVLLIVVKALLGAENVSAVSLQALSENRFAPAELFGRLANICGDLDARAVRQSDTFKMLTGGDPMMAERKHRDAFTFVPYALPIFSANEPPFSSDQSPAWFDRWVVVPMERRIPEERVDPTLASKLTTPAELEGVLVQAVAGLRRLMARGRFELSESIREAGARYRVRLDTVAAFVEEECQLHPELWTPRPLLYRRYRTWATEGGRLPVSAVTVHDHLRRNLAGQVEERTRRGLRGWSGIGPPEGTTW